MKINPTSGALILILSISLYFSCVNEPDVMTLITPDPTPMPQRQEYYSIEDFKGRDEGEEMPEWITVYLQGGLRGIESMEIYQFDYVFVSRNMGNNFSALSQWQNSFSPELDFPRLAATRIEERFLMEFSLPDFELGSFYTAFIRAISDSQWPRSTLEDDFWMLVKISPDAEPSWEFFILSAIPRNEFRDFFNHLYDNVNPRIAPNWEQQRAINRFRQNFFSEF